MKGAWAAIVALEITFLFALSSIANGAVNVPTASTSVTTCPAM